MFLVYYIKDSMGTWALKLNHDNCLCSLSLSFFLYFWLIFSYFNMVLKLGVHY
jgi:hypothetical protein